MLEARTQINLWGLRYASHMGFRSRNGPLFLEHAGGLDPEAHVKIAASFGFAGVQHPWAREFSDNELDDFSGALRSANMEGSCVVFAPLEIVKKPLWGSNKVAAREAILDHVKSACRVANKIRSKTVAIIATADLTEPFSRQRTAMKTNLRAAAAVAEHHEITLVIETMRTLPNMLLRSTDELIETVGDTDNPSVQMIFDTHHIAAMDGADRVTSRFIECFENIGLLQLGNYPEKVEPGSGEIDFVPLLTYAMRRQLECLVELEHLWSEPGLAGEISGLARFAEIDAAARAASAHLKEGD